MGDRSVAWTSASGNSSAISIDHWPVPVPMSNMRCGCDKGAK
jgi:hypothetical protein